MTYPRTCGGGSTEPMADAYRIALSPHVRGLCDELKLDTACAPLVCWSSILGLTLLKKKRRRLWGSGETDDAIHGQSES